MHRFSRMHLSPEVALRNLDAIDHEEKSRVAESVALVAVIDHRRDYLAAGYSSMHAYCTERLHMSEDRALRRIQVARVALRCPEVFEYLADGRLSVTTASVLAPHLTPGTACEILAAAAFRSRYEITRMLAERARPGAIPTAPAEKELVESCSTSHAPVHVPSRADLCAPVTGEPPLTTGEAKGRRGRMTHSATGEREVRLTLTDGEYEDLRAAMDLDAHAVPSGDPALVYARAIKHYREYLQKRRLGAKPGSEKSAHPCRGRGIPKALVQLVWERDGGQCKFIGKGGHRCEEKSGLQIDHITPFAKGGQATSDNLRLLCRAHNRFEAERVFGKEHVQRQRELAQRVRARDKVAAEVEAERAEARKGLAAEAGAASEHAPDGLAPEAGIQRAAGRSPAQQSRHDDIHSALRGLGFSAAEARRGAELADTMPDASLEACVKAALTALTRQVALRGERRARCTA